MRSPARCACPRAAAAACPPVPPPPSPARWRLAAWAALTRRPPSAAMRSCPSASTRRRSRWPERCTAKRALRPLAHARLAACRLRPAPCHAPLPRTAIFRSHAPYIPPSPLPFGPLHCASQPPNYAWKARGRCPARTRPRPNHCPLATTERDPPPLPSSQLAPGSPPSLHRLLCWGCSSLMPSHARCAARTLPRTGHACLGTHRPCGASAHAPCIPTLALCFRLHLLIACTHSIPPGCARQTRCDLPRTSTHQAGLQGSGGSSSQQQQGRQRAHE